MSKRFKEIKGVGCGEDRVLDNGLQANWTR